MTSEVAIMNRSAIALAADSAVTLQNRKILNSANKLHMLAPGYSIGVLVFNSDSLVGVPWELIIKLYRDRLLNKELRFPHLSDYTADFMEFVKLESEKLFTQGDQHDFFEFMMHEILHGEIIDYIDKRSQEKMIESGEKILGQELLDITTGQINALCGAWESAPDLFDEETSRQVVARLEESYMVLFNGIYETFFSKFELDAEVKDRLWKLCTHWFIKDAWFNLAFSGIVFAGYGDEDIYPSIIEYKVESYICGSLKHKLERNESGRHSRGIYSFAQNDIIQTLINGMHPIAWELLQKIYLHQMVTNQPNEEAGRYLNELRSRLQEGMREHYTLSIIGMVAALPKDDLAFMAETLVNITGFMRRVSSDQETFGGPTDVAVISKKDGFIWIKRKHYFDPEYNYHFFAGESGQYPGRNRDARTERETRKQQ